MQIRDEKHIRFTLPEHLLHTGIGQLGRRDIYAPAPLPCVCRRSTTPACQKKA